MYVDGQGQLEELCDDARKRGRCALDVEFIRERTYYPKLALVQLAVGEQAVLIDPLADVDLAPLDAILSDENVAKVLHAGKQDLEIFYHRTSSTPRAAFDTQIAAALLGMGNQIAYGTLVERMLGVVLEKGESFTDWLRRPLSSAQEEYALDDVRYLLPLHDRLQEELRKRGRERWAGQEFSRYEEHTLFEPDPAALYLRVRRSGTLNSRGLAILRELAQWREMEARDRDRPRRSVVADEQLVDIARRAPRSPQEVGSIRGLHPREVRRSTTQILASVARGLQIPDAECPVVERRRRMGRDEELLVDVAQAVLKAECQAAEVSPGMVANNADVQALVRSVLDGGLQSARGPLVEGWRGELVGARLLAFLDGKIELAVDPARRQLRLRDVSDLAPEQ